MPNQRKCLLVFLAGLASLVACSPGEEVVAVQQSGGFDVVEAGIADIQGAISRGDTSCRVVVQAYLDRIRAYDKSTGLNAITVINPNALTRADEIDSELERHEDPGVLFCSPMLVKDNYDTHDLPTTAGSTTLMDSYPPDDAFMVRRLREEGAIVIAKTNMAEWAFSPRETTSSSFGTTANAYALDRVPAGSSGGTASGVAASFGVAGMGSDTGNSIRGPSSHLALFGIRSTIGLTSRDGVVPLSYDRDIAGPMTRTVEDGARIFNVIAGYDPDDPLTEEGRGKREDDYTSFLDLDGLQGVRLGVLRVLVNTEEADKEVIVLFEQSLVDLKKAGAILVDPFVVEDFDKHVENTALCPRFRYDLAQYMASLGDGAPFIDVNKVLETGEYSPYIEEALKFFAGKPLDVAPENWEEPCPVYLDNPGRRAFAEATTMAMDDSELDAIIFPTWTNPPAHLDKSLDEYKGDNSQIIAPATGMPAVTVPMGFTYGQLPAGLQIVARHFDEGKLFKYAYAYEQATGHRRLPGAFPSLPH
jgi:Asp-tRNA(Asn)/Glu-tRNA(Gln) amidotransferase A subunit family amidase